jgi:hypothetical protein
VTRWRRLGVDALLRAGTADGGAAILTPPPPPGFLYGQSLMEHTGESDCAALVSLWELPLKQTGGARG